MKKVVLFLLTIIFMIGCKPNYSKYTGPQKAKHTYRGKSDNKWMENKREDMKQY